MKKAAWSFALTFWGFQVGKKCINSNQNQICTFVDQIYLSLDYTWLWQTTHSCILKFICFHVTKYNVVMTVAIMPSNAANSQCHSKLKFCKHFPVVSVVQFFMVVLHHQPGDSLLTADSKVQERTAGSGVFVPIRTEIWRPFREAWKDWAPGYKRPGQRKAPKKRAQLAVSQESGMGHWSF